MNTWRIRSRIYSMGGTAACVLAVLAMLGWHWVAIQSFAWARMVGHYARQGSLTSAIVKTFDGQHPCALCRMIEQGRQQEQRDAENLPRIKPGDAPEFICQIKHTPVPCPPKSATRAIPFVPCWAPNFCDSPPTPPPRAA